MPAFVNMDLIANEGCETTEGPLWHEDEQALYWLDIPAGTIYRYDAREDEHRIYHKADGPIGGFTLQHDGSLLLFGGAGAISLLANGEVTVLRPGIEGEEGSRFNDVVADPEGRVFCGTMPDGDRPGKLYRLDRDGQLAVVLEDAGLSNGMDFSPELTHFYHSDSDKGTITRFAYDRKTGDISEPEVIVRIAKEDGLPDGMAVDETGSIWSAIWDGGVLARFGPDGTPMEKVWFPARKVSSIAFGGADYSEAFVTLAGGNDPDTEGSSAGAVYAAELGAKGRAPFPSRVEPNGRHWGSPVAWAVIAPAVVAEVVEDEAAAGADDRSEEGVSADVIDVDVVEAAAVAPDDVAAGEVVAAEAVEVEVVAVPEGDGPAVEPGPNGAVPGDGGAKAE